MGNSRVQHLSQIGHKPKAAKIEFKTDILYEKRKILM